jgi:hypothetical protein
MRKVRGHARSLKRRILVVVYSKEFLALGGSI